MKRNVIILLVVGLVFAAMLKNRLSSHGNEPMIEVKERMQQPSAIEMMAEVFVGSHSEYEVKSKMDRVMKQYGYTPNEDNYHKCGSALLELRKSTGVPEMEIIDHMIASDTYKSGVSFADQAALSATLLR